MPIDKILHAGNAQRAAAFEYLFLHNLAAEHECYRSEPYKNIWRTNRC